ncbi:unnamed protein product, partial [Coregonus sp. 'balchen']
MAWEDGLSLHKGLPVPSILYGHGMTTCPRPTCGGEETLRHVFWGCAIAGVVWARAQVLIGRVRGDFVVTWARVERGVGKARGMAENGKDRERRGCGGDSEERVEQNLRGRMKREERKWGQHAARERWKGGLGLGVVCLTEKCLICKVSLLDSSWSKMSATGTLLSTMEEFWSWEETGGH